MVVKIGPAPKTGIPVRIEPKTGTYQSEEKTQATSGVFGP